MSFLELSVYVSISFYYYIRVINRCSRSFSLPFSVAHTSLTRKTRIHSEISLCSLFLFFFSKHFVNPKRCSVARFNSMRVEGQDRYYNLFFVSNCDIFRQRFSSNMLPLSCNPLCSYLLIRFLSGRKQKPVLHPNVPAHSDQIKQNRHTN